MHPLDSYQRLTASMPTLPARTRRRGDKCEQGNEKNVCSYILYKRMFPFASARCGGCERDAYKRRGWELRRKPLPRRALIWYNKTVIGRMLGAPDAPAGGFRAV